MRWLGWFRKPEPLPQRKQSEVDRVLSDLWSQQIEYASNSTRSIVDFITDTGTEYFAPGADKIAWPKIVYPKPWQFAWWRWKSVALYWRLRDTWLVLAGKRETRDPDDYDD
jgi:hypothetical protein